MRLSVLSVILQQVLLKSELGLLQGGQKLLRQQVRFTVTLKKVLSEQKLLRMMNLLNVAAQ
jgi:hypothetical protein